jgi:hypothetical protein
MQTAPESWTSHLRDEFDRYVATLTARDGTRYRSALTGKAISESEFGQIRNEVIANATSEPTSLAYHMLLRSGSRVHTDDPCPTGDAVLRLAWGASATRRLLGLPASSDIM